MERRPSRILIVEDDLDLRHLFRLALTVEGFAVTEASDGLSALRAIEEDRPDLLILDLGLPTISGVWVQQELAAHPRTESLPILVVTGSTADVRTSRHVRVLRKPVAPDRLVAEVRLCLQAYRTNTADL
jgi:DNA-binding response OmpR family regulator